MNYYLLMIDRVHKLNIIFKTLMKSSLLIIKKVKFYVILPLQ